MDITRSKLIRSTTFTLFYDQNNDGAVAVLGTLRLSDSLHARIHDIYFTSAYSSVRLFEEADYTSNPLSRVVNCEYRLYENRHPSAEVLSS